MKLIRGIVMAFIIWLVIVGCLWLSATHGWWRFLVACLILGGGAIYLTREDNDHARRS